MTKQKVNDKCLCGSGKKFKKCCINKTKEEILLLMQKNGNEETRLLMEKNGNEAHELYKICCDEGCDGLFDPVIWILNQNKMRCAWENYKLKLENEPEFFKNMMLNNSLSQYMSFMYNNYPSGLGDKLKERFNTTEVPFDELFL